MDQTLFTRHATLEIGILDEDDNDETRREWSKTDKRLLSSRTSPHIYVSLRCLSLLPLRPTSLSTVVAANLQGLLRACGLKLGHYQNHGGDLKKWRVRSVWTDTA